MKKKTSGLLDLTEEFCRAFCERYHAYYKEHHQQVLERLSLNVSYDEVWPLSAAHEMLSCLHILFCEQYPKWQVDELFAEFGPPPKRKAASDRRNLLAFRYGAEGKPPKSASPA